MKKGHEALFDHRAALAMEGSCRHHDAAQGQRNIDSLKASEAQSRALEQHPAGGRP